jgi:hypothetical protein
MTIQLEQVNRLALLKTIEAMGGAQAVQQAQVIYRAIDTAMTEGYTLGLTEGQSNTKAAYDAGYSEGVKDARLDPAKADEALRKIDGTTAEAVKDAETLDGFYEGDSGDETKAQ